MLLPWSRSSKSPYTRAQLKKKKRRKKNSPSCNILKDMMRRKQLSKVIGKQVSVWCVTTVLKTKEGKRRGNG